MTLADDPQQRETILRDLLESLGIDAKQAQESRESAARYLRYMASKKRREERAAKPTANDPIDSMNLDELRAHNRQLFAKLERLLAEGTDPQPAPPPEQAPTIEEAPQYDVTAKQRRRLAAFDDLSDADQVDQLKDMWG